MTPLHSSHHCSGKLLLELLFSLLSSCLHSPCAHSLVFHRQTPFIQRPLLLLIPASKSLSALSKPLLAIFPLPIGTSSLTHMKQNSWSLFLTQICPYFTFQSCFVLSRIPAPRLRCSFHELLHFIFTNSCAIIFLLYIQGNGGSKGLINLPKNTQIGKVFPGLKCRSIQLKGQSSVLLHHAVLQTFRTGRTFHVSPKLNTSVFFDSSHFLITCYYSTTCPFYLEEYSSNLFLLHFQSHFQSQFLSSHQEPSIQSLLHVAVKVIFENPDLIVPLPC